MEHSTKRGQMTLPSHQASTHTEEDAPHSNTSTDIIEINENTPADELGVY